MRTLATQTQTPKMPMTPETGALLLIVFFLYTLTIIASANLVWTWYAYSRPRHEGRINRWQQSVDQEYPDRSGFTHVWGEATDPDQYEISTNPPYHDPCIPPREMMAQWNNWSSPSHSPMASSYRRRDIKRVQVSDHPLTECPIQPR